MSEPEQNWSSLRKSAEEMLRKTRRDVAEVPTEDVQRLVHELQVHQVELQMQNDDLRSRTCELEAARIRYQELFDLAPAGYLELDANGVIRRANFAAALLLGVDREQLVGKQFENFVDHKHLVPLREHLRTALQKGSAVRELRLSRASGAPVYVLVETHWDAAPSDGYLLALMDVTERRLAEEILQDVNEELERRVASRTLELAAKNRLLEQEIAAKTKSEEERKRLAERLRDAERMESLGLLAGGIAHDFNNLLVGVLANADLLLREKCLQKDAEESVRSIEQAARRASTLTRQLLVYAGRSDIEFAPVDLGQAIVESLNLLRASVPPLIEIQTQIGKLRPILADRGQVQQVISNLVINAIEAIGERAGTVVLHASRQDLDAVALADYTRTSGARPGAFAVLEVTDTGSGMSVQTLSRLFDPFFTTKFTGRGLGLASVLGILQGHHCAVRVSSQPEQGTTFVIAWPEASTPASTSVVPVRTESWRGTGRVLVVDDDTMVLAAVGRQLEYLGFEVVKATGGAEALRLFAEATSPFALVVLDRTMPDLSGEEVLCLLRESSPDLPVVLMSGFSAAGVELPRNGIALLQKPMTVDDLGCAARSLLEPQE